jgi:hypothetical protein
LTTIDWNIRVVYNHESTANVSITTFFLLSSVEPIGLVGLEIREDIGMEGDWLCFLIRFDLIGDVDQGFERSALSYFGWALERDAEFRSCGIAL